MAVVGVSSDTQEVADRFAASLELPYPLVGNQDGSVGAAYGVKWPVIGFFRRASFVIGRDGVIEAALRQESKPLTHANWALDKVRRRTKA
jgi:thioredoxin-dependent peroxiredoxin